MINVLVNGALGRMGSLVINAVEQAEDMSVAAGVDVFSKGGAVYGSLDRVTENVDVVIDFSHHTLTPPLLDWCVEKNVPAVVCTTGHDEAETAAIERASKSVPVFHNRKLDAPSGTALMLARELQTVRPGSTLSMGRSGQARREKNEIGIQAVRMGNLPGTHAIMISTDTQTLSLKHEAHDRALFADGALAAARYLMGKPAGLYDMKGIVAGK